MQNLDNYYEKIKERIIDTEVTIRVKDYSKNRVVLENYYEIGRIIIEAQGGEERAKYGNHLIKTYSEKLSNELGKKYSTRYLELMRKFYLFQKAKPVVSKLNWSHYVLLLSLKNENEIDYYITLCTKYNLSKRQLHEKIKNKEYQNLSNDTKQKLIENKKPELVELVKDPIIIPNPNNIEVIKEKTLQKLILEDIPFFLKQLGNDYMFVDNEYPIKIDSRYYRIDLLLYNMEYESYVVVELKIGELKKEHLGQIKFYMNYIDKHKKKITQNPTIGIILCHKNNKLILEYSSDPRIISREYLIY